jgi:hypothetical protein
MTPRQTSGQTSGRSTRSKGRDAGLVLTPFDGGPGRSAEEETRFLERLSVPAPKTSPYSATHGSDVPCARRLSKPLSASRRLDQLDLKRRHAEDRQEALLDEGVEETFPASDPVSVKRIT